MWKKLGALLMAIVFVGGTTQAALAFGGPWQKDKQETLWQSVGLDLTTVQQGLKDGKSIKEIAQEQGISEEALTQKVLDNAKKALEQAVQDGKMTKEQADAKLKVVEENISKWIDQSGPLNFNMMHENMKRERVDGQDAGRMMRTGFSFWNNEALADLFGMSIDELKNALTSGKSLTQLAEEKQVSLDRVQQLLLEQMKERLSSLVQSGRLTEEQMNARLSQFEANLPKILDQTCQSGENGSNYQQKMQRNWNNQTQFDASDVKPSVYPKQMKQNKSLSSSGQTI
ncbi:MAG: hypothetical protein BSOLF_2922 [Candidatus Carbobacillus altaicus]|uniref:Uncharacterized protein n=1 Tax=Candidatus Carbonibacillus altaicus TaxID=2163959 RepID=A0A2R6XXQ0_9BACL|nr:MAG: hypothetical protein BSOLF_2922 [Candidatus Carbobacillus altaicus]